MLLSPRKNGLTSLFKEVRVFKADRRGTSRVFGKPCFCALPKRGRFDENGESDEFAYYPLKTKASLLRPPKTTKIKKWRVSLRQMHGLEKAGLFFPDRRCDGTHGLSDTR